METEQLHPLTLKFRSRDMEAEYWSRFEQRMRRRTLVAVGIVLVLYGIFGFLDPWIVPEIVPQAWTIRGMVFGLCVLLMLLTRTRLFARAHQAILLSLPLLGGLGILVMIALGGETGRLLYYVGLILAIIWTMLFADLNFILAAAASAYLIAGYEIIALFISPLPLPVIVNNTFFLVGAFVMSASAGYTVKRAARVNFQQSLVIEHERHKSETLLLNILPREISEILKSGSGSLARRYDQASILFADIVGFTSLSALMGAEETVEFLNRAFSHFDSLVEKYDLEKIRTIGDNYMVAAGVPRPCPGHARSLALMALDMRAYAESSGEPAPGRLRLRIGINTGPVVAGVIGRKKFQYDIWGDAVNIASRMESQGLPGEIQITKTTRDLIKDEFRCRHRGRLQIKGVGAMETYLLVDRRRPARRRQTPPGSSARETVA
jgi:guanylate cyclase